jgi:predicted GNAT family acetyltransferase
MITELVVEEGCRGRGVGKALAQSVIDEAMAPGWERKG